MLLAALLILLFGGVLAEVGWSFSPHRDPGASGLDVARSAVTFGLGISLIVPVLLGWH